MVIHRVDYYGLRNRLLLRKQIRGACVLSSYDSWKCTDPQMERAGAVEDALDEYQELVWDQVVNLYPSERGGEVPRETMEAFEKYRDVLHDLMCDDRLPEDAAQLFLER